MVEYKTIWKCGCKREEDGTILRCPLHSRSKESTIPLSLNKYLIAARNALKVGDFKAASLLHHEAVQVCGRLYLERGGPRPPKRISVKLMDLKMLIEEAEKNG